jgi:hypothetical protein
VANELVSTNSERTFTPKEYSDLADVPPEVANNRIGALDKHLDPGSIYCNIVMKYAKATGVAAEAVGVRVHSMRATAATNAPSNEADIAKGAGVARPC